MKPSVVVGRDLQVAGNPFYISIPFSTIYPAESNLNAHKFTFPAPVELFKFFHMHGISKTEVTISAGVPEEAVEFLWSHDVSVVFHEGRWVCKFPNGTIDSGYETEEDAIVAGISYFIL